MAKNYRKADNCGPVPYPNDSSKMLQEGEVVSGEEWEPLAVLGYVVPVEDAPKSVEKPVEEPAKVEAAPVEHKPAPKPGDEEDASAPKKKAKAKKPKAEAVEEVSDDGMRDATERSGAEAVDPPEAGEPGGEGVSG